MDAQAASAVTAQVAAAVKGRATDPEAHRLVPDRLGYVVAGVPIAEIARLEVQPDCPPCARCLRAP